MSVDVSERAAAPVQPPVDVSDAQQRRDAGVSGADYRRQKEREQAHEKESLAAQFPGCESGPWDYHPTFPLQPSAK